MVQRGRKTGYSIGIRKKKELLFTDLCTMYFKKCQETYKNIYTTEELAIFLKKPAAKDTTYRLTEYGLRLYRLLNVTEV